MTTSNLPDFTDPEYEILPLYIVSENLALETGKSIGLWLFRIIQAVHPYNEPPRDSNSTRLILRPDKKWGTIKSREEVKYGNQNRKPLWFDPYAPKEVVATYSVEYYDYGSWDIRESILNWFLSTFSTPPINDWEFQGIDIRLNKEGVCLHRNDFRAWCLASNYPLPRFWFGEVETPSIPAAPNQEDILAAQVRELFWGEPIPEGHNRPTRKQIVSWLMSHPAKGSLTEKAATRIYQSTKPSNIPSHGNLSQQNKPFPEPPYPIK
ncbi:hypothetical protein [uncultured Desulfuromonas sp.]|uniref:hypothetical protein n=1 Tax=uncultured Desulfuromonas sp. TaxID=181013 RepID=UPI002AABFCA9|nr:hypothetical protein [uncultured Desulfuromonas sp.]